MNVLYFEGWGFPYGLAAIQKMRLISRSLVGAGANVTVISNRAVHRRGSVPDFPPEGTFEGINYVYTAGSIYRPDSPLPRNLMKIKGVVKELYLLLRLARQGRIDAAILGTLSFWWVLYYACISRVLRFPLVYEYVEFLSSHSARNSMTRRLNDRLIDRYVFRLVDGVLPISNFLSNHAKRIAPRLPQLQIPVLVDSRRFSPRYVKSDPPYFLFCGSLAYLEVIVFILDAYDRITSDSQSWLLYLIVNGKNDSLKNLQEQIRVRKNASGIRVLSGLAESELEETYANASAMLIPLRPNLQDQARFPHKIGEYLATGNPVVTTDYGEASVYFLDGVNALVASRYEPGEFATKLDWVIAHPGEAKMIGERGRALALRSFEYSLYGDPLREFLSHTAKNGRAGNGVKERQIV